MNSPFFQIKETLTFTREKPAVQVYGDKDYFKWMHGYRNPDKFQFSIMFWIKTLVPLGGRYGIFSTGNGESNKIGVNCDIDNSHNLNLSRYIGYYICRGETGKCVIDLVGNNSFVNDGNWHHYCFTHNQALEIDNGKMYIDGKLVKTESKTEFKPSQRKSTSPLSIGTWANGWNKLVGSIMDFRIYKEEINQEELLKIIGDK